MVQQQSSLARMHPAVLIVDDDDDVREAVAALLTEEGFPVALANDGIEALAMLHHRELLPCVILLDRQMPIMDGDAFREEQLKDPALADIPVIMITATAGPALPGVTKLRKPVRPDVLLAKLRELCMPRAPEEDAHVAT